MKKVYIRLDEEKVLREGKYDLGKIKSVIDDLFLSRDLKKTEEGFYEQTHEQGDFEKMWGINISLGNQAWFRENVAEWKWFNSDEKDDPDNYVVEDIIESWTRVRGFRFEAAKQQSL